MLVWSRPPVDSINHSLFVVVAEGIRSKPDVYNEAILGYETLLLVTQIAYMLTGWRRIAISPQF